MAKFTAMLLGKGKSKASEPDDDEDLGLEYGKGDEDGDTDAEKADDAASEDELNCADDLISAVKSGDAQAVVDAIKALTKG